MTKFSGGIDEFEEKIRLEEEAKKEQVRQEEERRQEITQKTRFQFKHGFLKFIFIKSLFRQTQKPTYQASGQKESRGPARAGKVCIST